MVTMDSTSSPRDGTILVFSWQGRRRDFSLVLGGPFFQLLRRMHLSGDALELLGRRILAILAVVWLPLLGLSTLKGEAWGGTAAGPFLLDVGANIRFLVTVPLLIGAELFVHRRMRDVVQQFVDRNVIREGALPRFDAAITSALRLRNSVLAEGVLIGLVYIGGVSLWRHFSALSTGATWFAVSTAEGLRPSPAGWWYAYVSLPVFQFLLLRWYYRFIIWAQFLWQVSRLELSLIPTHPDRVGGLGFLADVSYAFTPLALAHGAMLAGLIANQIFYFGSALTDFNKEIVVVVLFLLCIVLGPFLVFAPQLVAAKRIGLGEYGTLAELYVREFEARWLRGGASVNERLLGSADIQSLADLDGSFEVVNGMRAAPITRDAFLSLIVATLAPLVPLMLTMISLPELLKKVVGVFF
jgi:hypothetical protein